MEKRSPDSGKKAEKSKRQEEVPVSQQESQYLTRCTRFRLSTEYELSICNCKHIMRMTIGERHSVVNPQRWLCNLCYTTESVWACLSCPNVACGRYIHEHALNHYLESHHPLVIDVNELYVYCYECEEYVLNDNKSGDIKVLRETLQAIRYQNFTGTTRSGHTLRTATISADEDVQMRLRMQQQQLDRDDRLFTAIWHSRFVRQRKTFRAWVNYMKNRNKDNLSDNSDDELSKLDITAQPNTVLSITEPVVDKESAATADSNCEIHTATSINEPIKTEISDMVLFSKSESASTDSATVISPTEVEEMGNVDIKDSPPICDQAPAESQLCIEPEHPNIVIVLSDKIPDDSPESLDIEDKLLKAKEEQETKVELESPPLKEEPIGNSKEEKMVDHKLESATTPVTAGPQPVSPMSPPPSISPCRPKRANAASRYKEIMTRLSQSGEPPRKRQCTSEHKSPQRVKPPPTDQVSIRRSLRLQHKEEKAYPKQKRKRQRKPSVKLTSKRNSLPRTQSKKYLPPRARVCRRVTSESGTKSLYDCVPNRAVASLIPGVTGLRNLGNTCYLNSIIQVLGHLQKFRLCLFAVRDIEMDDFPRLQDGPHPVSPSSKFRVAGRRSTIEMYENQMTVESKKLLKLQAGLNGGHESTELCENEGQDRLEAGEPSFSHRHKLRSNGAASQNPLSLCHELHDLYHIMWSGKWKLVSPYHFLSSVWQLIPSFRGYSQQDAQEFLCELLDKIVSELERRHIAPRNPSSRLSAKISRVVHKVFEGRLHSKVRCLDCRHVSSTIEAFWDLSLEFPQRYHTSNTNWKNQAKSCSLLEMLDKFTEAERLDGGKVYNCSRCNNNNINTNGGGVAGSRSRKKPARLSQRKVAQKLSDAEKQIKVTELPQILRFHLKRFRWSGRNHREKITVPVNFPAELDMKSHCWLNDLKQGSSSGALSSDSFMYDLSAVVIHHGRGFGSGHYTAYCWNDVGKFWVHCNDSNLELCSIDDVMESQAYILFYTQRGVDPQPHIFSPPPTPDLSPPPSPLGAPGQGVSPET